MLPVCAGITGVRNSCLERTRTRLHFRARSNGTPVTRVTQCNKNQQQQAMGM